MKCPEIEPFGSNAIDATPSIVAIFFCSCSSSRSSENENG
jgi:hypothetical protein